jgi:hypothetical protein
MSAEDLLAECQALGIDLQAHRGQVDIDAPEGVLSDELLQRLRDAKPELLMILATPSTPSTPSTAEPSSWPVISSAIECAEAAAIFCVLLTADDLPPVPFDLNPWTEVRDASKMLRWLRSKILRVSRGSIKHNSVLSADVLALKRIVLKAADDKHVESDA